MSARYTGMGRAVFDTVFRTMWFAILCWASAFAFFAQSSDVSADDFFTLKGHGGPVMDIAVSAGNGQIASASFDNSIGVWTGRTPEWLDG
ncbi:MAG: WD40 repeat domain-containing protein, partial [Rhizobiaceae bacterium]